MKPFLESAAIYDALYCDKDYEGEAKSIIDLALKVYEGEKKDISSIISFGCGTGSYEALLADMGLKVHGVDISPKMIEVAKKKKEELSFQRQSLLSFEVHDIENWRGSGEYDLAIFLFHVINYLSFPGGVSSALRAASSAIKKGGIIIFDSWNGEGVLLDPPKARKKEVRYKDSALIREAIPEHDPSTSTISVAYNYKALDNALKHFTEVHNMRYLFLDEVKGALLAEGFSLVGAYSNFNLDPLIKESWNAVYAARKI